MAVYVEDVIKELQRLTHDDTYTPSILLDLINQGIQETAAAILPNGTEILLPALETTGTVHTSTTYHYADMPSNFGRKLLSVFSTDQDEYVKLDPSLALLNKHYPSGLDDEGNVERCARVGSVLWYNPMPASSDTLTVHYFKKPTAVSFTDEISEIPEHFVKPILKNYCLKEIFEEKEIHGGLPVSRSAIYNQNWLAKCDEMALYIGNYAFDYAQIQDEYGMRI